MVFVLGSNFFTRKYENEQPYVSIKRSTGYFCKASLVNNIVPKICLKIVRNDLGSNIDLSLTN